jgi:isopenicillin N synthase-like dioxygenase
MDLFRKFISGTHSIALKLLECLSTGMGLTGATRFENSHRADVPARTTMILFRHPRELEQGGGLDHNMHTNIGSLTLLFCETFGLQVCSPKTGEWGFIAHMTGHAVVNVGDSLRLLSGHELNSSLNRVIPVKKRQEEHLYSIGYFLRPEDEAVYVDSKGREISARAWHNEKYNAVTSPHEEQEQDMVHTEE